VSSAESRFWWSRDNVRLHLLDYGDANEQAPVVLCLPGLTRNHRDFEPFVAHVRPKLAGKARIWCADLRGRGESGWAKDPLTYVPVIYLQDMECLIEQLKPSRLVLVGTSLGGILSMLMASSFGHLIAGAVLNDVGPVLDPSGLQRIRGYVGKTGPYPTWMHAAHVLQETQHMAYPGFAMTDWLAMAKRLGRLEPNGRIEMDYDPRISEPFKLPGGDGGSDLWPLFDMLAQKPVTVLRGEFSDILAAQTLTDMAARHASVTAVTVPGVGHAPVLDEPVAIAALDDFFAKVLP
jgi:pimeloyl-ACP methyl ester carboxylesterase